MLVGICDFPSSYDFPPDAYGGIERWLWAVAVGARQAGAEVHLLGPQWRSDLGPEWIRKPVRLEDEPDLPELKAYDLLVVGHEYPSLPSWRRTWEQLDCDVATFQHNPNFQHTADAFDAVRSRLYCYSAEMRERYAAHQPIAELAVHLGLNEAEPAAVDGKELIWLGRIDAEKAPHLAIMAARRLGRRIRMVGPVFDADYVARHRSLFESPNVEVVGELGGPAKAQALCDGAVFVYTYARDYVEAGAAVFGESLRAGTPVAGLTWRDGTCAQAAVCADTGRAVVADPSMSDAAAAEVLASAIDEAAGLKAATVQEVGMHRFDPRRHFEALASRR